MSSVDGSSVLMVYMTFPNREEALRICRCLVQDHLLACANLLPGMTSLYTWDGEVRQDEETAVLAKTPADRLAALKNALAASHPYQTPCLVAWPIADGLPAFLEWVATATRKPV